MFQAATFGNGFLITPARASTRWASMAADGIIIQNFEIFENCSCQSRPDGFEMATAITPAFTQNMTVNTGL
jgi:hypothetical protein